MPDILYQLLLLKRIYRRISALPLDDRARRELFAAHLRTTFLRRRGFRGMTAYIGLFKVRYCNYGSFVYLFREIFLNGEYNFSCGSPRPYILDCGSNIGMSVLYFKARFPQAEITAFEPDLDAFGCLERNIADNALHGVQAHNKAVSGLDGEVTFWRGENPGGLGNTIYPNPSKKGLRVRSVRLSPYIDRRVDVLKLDAEGAEFEIVEELSSAGKLELVDQMFIECHLNMPGTEGRMAGLLRALEENGFGYQLGGESARPLDGGNFQTVHVYAYRKTAGRSGQN